MSIGTPSGSGALWGINSSASGYNYFIAVAFSSGLSWGLFGLHSTSNVIGSTTIQDLL